MEKLTLAIKDAAATAEPDVYDATMLVGDGTYNGVFFPKDEVMSAALSMKGRPVNLDHSEKVEDVVGVVSHAYAINGSLKGSLRLNPQAPKYAIAKAHLDGQLALGATPNVSVEVYHKPTRETVNGAERLTARSLDFVALAIVQVGACDDKTGCGVHASRYSRENPSMTETPNTPAGPTPEQVKESLCAKDAAISALKAERDGYATKLATESARADKAEGELNALKLSAERAPIVAELATLAPDFKPDELSNDGLKVALAAVKAVRASTPPAGGRRTALAATPPGGNDKAAEEKARLSKLMGLTK